MSAYNRIEITDRKEILRFARFLERRRLHPEEPLFVTYAEFYGEVVYDETRLVPRARKGEA